MLQRVDLRQCLRSPHRDVEDITVPEALSGLIARLRLVVLALVVDTPEHGLVRGALHWAPGAWSRYLVRGGLRLGTR